MAFQADPFGHHAYQYKPRTDTLIERHPDRRPSDSRIALSDTGRSLLWVLEVRGHGAITMRASSDRATGRLAFVGVSLFTDDEIKFD